MSVHSSFSTTTPQRHQPLPVPLKVVALGDSLIYGFGDTEGGGWVERLRRQWLNPSSTAPILYNLGVRGDTVRQVNQRLESEFSLRGELRNRQPDRIILSAGVNDSARLGRLTGRLMTPLETFQAELTHLLDAATRLAPVCFIGMVPVEERAMPFLGSFYFNHEDQYAFKEATRAACTVRNIPYLDIFELWRQRGTVWCAQRLSSDGLHPNGQGYEDLLADIEAWSEWQQFLS